ncbi:hypothetical protein [Pseudomonas veronii]
MDRFPQHNRGGHQIEVAGSVALLFEAPIPGFAHQAVSALLTTAVKQAPFVKPSAAIISNSKMLLDLFEKDARPLSARCFDLLFTTKRSLWER